MPWTCDALLPTAERYASLKFRRVARGIYPNRLDYGDAVELIAFVRTIGFAPARYVFHWKPGVYQFYKKLEAEVDAEVVGQAVRENREAYTPEQGLLVLDAMRDGGFSKGRLPEIVRMSILEMRKQGFSQTKIAEFTGLTLDQVRGTRRVRTAVRLADAALVAQ